MTIQMNHLAIIEEITAYGHLIRMAIIPKFTLFIVLQRPRIWQSY